MNSMCGPDNIKTYVIQSSSVYWLSPDVIMSCLNVAHCLSGCGCAMGTAWHVTGRLTCPIPQPTILLRSAAPTDNEGIYVEKPAKTQISIRLASRSWSECQAPNVEDVKFESPVWTWDRHADIIEDLLGGIVFFHLYISPHSFSNSNA